MKILLTGATGYIGRRLLPVLVDHGHEVTCCVRGGNPFLEAYQNHANITAIEMDFLNKDDLRKLPKDIDVAYFLMHSMSSSTKKFDTLEKSIASNFMEYISGTSARQIIYLSGLVPDDEMISKHLKSRWDVEKILNGQEIPLTVLRAGIVVGSGSASFEIIRDLVEKLPIMIAPRGMRSKCQPIAIRNIIQYLIGVTGKEQYYGKTFDIGGPDVLTYREMLLEYAKVRKLKRSIFISPFVSSRISSYWLFFVTSTAYKLAATLVDSMQHDLTCGNNILERELNIKPIPYKEAIKLAFTRIEQNMVLSSWKDAINEPELYTRMSELIQVPQHGVLNNSQSVYIGKDCSQVVASIWSIGGNNGWYYANWLWKIRGALDRLIGGVGLRRGRTHPYALHPGDALDFWRVLVADRTERRLLLYAEMAMPGDGWLEFKIIENEEGFYLKQTATFRPSGLTGRLYWVTLYPVHLFMFSNMAKAIVHRK